MFEPYVITGRANQSISGSKTFNSSSDSYDLINYGRVMFATEKINMPRENVVTPKEDSAVSSPCHGFK
jgi:hypothetical protein